MNPNLNFGQIRGTIDQIAALVWWAAGLVLVVMFGAVVARETGHAIPYVPTPDSTKLAYLSAICWLLKR